MKRLVDLIQKGRFSQCLFPTFKGVVPSFLRMMSVVNVRCVEEDDVMAISFTYEGKQRKMQRAKMEVLGKALARITLSTSGKKKGKKTERGLENTPLHDMQQKKASLWYDGNLIDENLPNQDAWQENYLLKIGDLSYHVQRNPPTILSLSLPTSFMSGFPVFPIIELDFAQKQFCSYTWFKLANRNDTEASSIPTSDDGVWEIVGRDFCYTPTILEVGCFLKLECTPASAKCSSVIKSEAISLGTVSAGPGESPFDIRHLYTKKRSEDPMLFRTVCYNTLADTYTKEESALKMLYPYCPPYALSIQYRQQLILKELIGYNADIICLQECGHKLFWNTLSPALEVLGFHGLLCSKAGEVPEGEVLFFHRDKFELCSQHNIILQESLFNDQVQEGILDKVCVLPVLCETLRNRNTVAQVTVLKPTAAESERLCVVNTHLYFKPSSPHVRLIQVGVILNHIKKILGQVCEKQPQSSTADADQGKNQTIKEQTLSLLSQTHAMSELENEPCNKSDEGMTNSAFSISNTCSTETTGAQFDSETNIQSRPSAPKVAVLFCGDFNSDPRSGVYQLLNTGRVAEGHRDWTFCADKDEHCTMLSLSHDFKLFSACGTPQFTNFTGGFKGTLDYVFADGSQLDVEAIVPLPSEEQLEVYIALPSVVLPSDHVALVCELKWKSPSGHSL